MLTKLELENWRGIKRGVIEGFRRINVLVGRNNSGKSSVLDAISVLNPEAEQLLKSRRLGREWADLIHIGQSKATVRALVNDKTVEYSVLMEADKVVTQLTESLPKDANGLTIPELVTLTVSQILPQDVQDFLRRIVLLDSSQLYKPSLDDFYFRLLAQEKRLDKEWLRLVNEVYGLNAEYVTRTKFPTLSSPERLVVVLGEPENRAVAVEWLGDGVRLGMTVLAAALVMDGGVLLLEEPENHQHPSALFGLAKALMALTKARGIQIFATTHSRECMQALLKAATEEQFGGELRFFHLQLLVDGTLWVRGLDAPDVEVLEDIGYDFRFDYEFASPRTS